MRRIIQFATVAGLLVFGFWAQRPAAASHTGPVMLQRVPNGGIQPQVAAYAKGGVHMIYFTGDPGHGDLYYVRSSDGAATFSHPLRVNTGSGSAVATGNVRGAHLAAGRNGRVHVAWMGSSEAQPKGPSGAAPMLYTRLNDAATAFEPERNVIQVAYGLDGGGTVAADGAGDVYVFWHAPAPGRKGENERRVWVARSADDGKTFDRERPAYDAPTGACACCGMGAWADAKANLYVLYRSATELVNRDIYLLSSKDRGKSFQGSDISKWNVGYCVMSTQALSEGPSGVLAAWESDKQVYFGRIDPATGKISQPAAAPGSTNDRKHPAIAANARGETLLAWTEGMGWKKGGSLAWQVFDKSGKPIGEAGHAGGVPTWSLVAAYARPDGGFTVVY